MDGNTPFLIMVGRRQEQTQVVGKGVGLATTESRIINGDSAIELKKFADNSIDAVITDPPYGIEFLAKDWDRNTGAVEIWQECLRVLKPGGFLLAFSAARTYHKLATNIESVGFEIREQIMWLYASGFPKAQDIGKAIQRRQGVEETMSLEEYEKLTGVTNLPKGNQTFGHNDDTDGQKSAGLSGRITIPTSPEAQKWSGWKTQLKPAHEPICMARKPFKGSAIDNVLTHGVGALNIDESRIPFEGEADMKEANVFKGTRTTGMDQYCEPSGTLDKNKEKLITGNTEGRFPSNVLGEVEGYQKYFYCPKVSRKERMDFNNHPTVKPVDLMKYLIKLVAPQGAHVLDPFCGSGSTGMACKELGNTFTGIEQDKNYVTIAQQRIDATVTDPKYTLFE